MSKTIIISGGTSGIGLDIARFFYQRGFNISLCGKVKSSLIQKLKKEFSSEDSLIQSLDLTKRSNIKKFVQSTFKKFRSIDVLVNCAGRQHVAPIEKFQDEIWTNIININLNAAFFMIKETLPMMRKAKWGRIINISSVHGTVASPFKAGYVSSKHGLVGLSKVIALETAKENITCNAICPGFVLTDLIEDQIKTIAKKKNISYAKAKTQLLKEKQPSMEFVTRSDVASMAYYLTTDAAAQITGSNLIIDGGWSAQ